MKNACENVMNLEDRIIRSISLRKGTVVLRSELAPLGSAAQITRVLAQLLEKGKLVRVSKGVFAKTRINKFTGTLTVAGSLENIASETFRKLGIPVRPGRLIREYNERKTTQIPVELVADTGKRRISRKIEVAGRMVKYENDRTRTAY